MANQNSNNPPVISSIPPRPKRTIRAGAAAVNSPPPTIGSKNNYLYAKLSKTPDSLRGSTIRSSRIPVAVTPMDWPMSPIFFRTSWWEKMSARAPATIDSGE